MLFFTSGRIEERSRHVLPQPFDVLRVLPDQAAGALLQRIGKTAFADTCDSGVGLDGHDRGAKVVATIVRVFPRGHWSFAWRPAHSGTYSLALDAKDLSGHHTRVTRDVKVGDRVAIPSGARAIGAVTLVERGGKFKERARLGIRFHTLVLADGTRIPMNTETIFREGDAPGNSSAAKIGGGAVGGAIIGAILGGAKGAAIGATTGAGAGTAAVAAGDRSSVVLQPGTPLTVRVQQPVTVTVEKE